MHIIKLKDRNEFNAGDGSMLREILNPKKQPLLISYSLARAIVGPKQRTQRHQLMHSEVYYIISGTGLMQIDEEQEPVKKDDAVYIPPGAIQSIENTGDDPLIFLCIVDPAWQSAIEKVLE